MKNILQIILISLVCLTFISCAKEDDTSTTTTTTELEGTWSAACYVDSDNLSNKNTITVSGTDVIVKYEIHSDTSCNTDLLTYDDTYSSLSIGDNASFSSGATGHKFTFNVVSFKATPEATAMASALNAESSCGVSDWALDTATDYTGKTCGSTVYAAANTTFLGLYKLVGNNLFLGDFSSTGSYPTSVYNTITFVKQ